MAAGTQRITEELGLEHGDAIVRLAHTGWRWVSRRTDRVEFFDEMTIRRTTTVEIDLPVASLSRLPRLGGLVCLPAATLHRTEAYDVTARAADGSLLHVLPRERERRFVAQGILARLVAEAGAGWRVDAASLELIWAAISGRGSCEQVLGDLPADVAETGAALVEWWGSRFLVLVAVQAGPQASVDGLLTTVVLEQHEPFPDDGTPLSQVPAMMGNAPLPRGSVRWLYETDNVDAAASYHFDLLAPPATAVVSATMRFAVEEGDDGHVEPRVVEIQEPPREMDRKRVSLAWSHERARLQAIDGSLTVGSSALVNVAFIPLPHGNLMAGRIAAWASAASLVALATVSIIDALSAPATFGWTLDANSIVTMLLIGPTLLIGVIVQREDGHFMTRRIYRTSRSWLVSCAVMTFLSAMLVAVGADANWLAGLLLLPAAVTVALALAIELIYQGAVSVLRGARVRGCAWQMPSRCTGAQRKA